MMWSDGIINAKIVAWVVHAVDCWPWIVDRRSYQSAPNLRFTIHRFAFKFLRQPGGRRHQRLL